MARTVEDLIHWLDHQAADSARTAQRYQVGSPFHKQAVGMMIGFKEASRALLTYREAMGEPGLLAIANERFRQIGEEGFTVEHDVKTRPLGELALAAVCYAGGIKWPVWPWSDDWWKPSPDRRRNLVKAGALLAAEIDRIDFMKEKRSAPQERKVAENRVREHPHGDQRWPPAEAGSGYRTFEGWEEPEEKEGC